MQHPIRHRLTWLSLVFVLSVGLVISMSACTPGGTTGAPQSTNTAATEGTVDGLVVASPSCPVERAEQPCPPKPVPDRIVKFEGMDGKVVKQVATDQAGHFTVALAPGTYVLQVAPGASQYPVQRQPQQVTVIAGKTVQVQIKLDSGIR